MTPSARAAVRSILRTTDQRLDWLTVPVFGNWNRLDLNVLHFAHHALCRVRRWRAGDAESATPDPGVAAAVQGLRRDGYYLFAGDVDLGLLHRVQRRADELFGQVERCWKPKGAEEFVTFLRDAVGAIPEAVGLLSPRISATAERLFGSSFKIYSLTCYRTFPTDETPRRSWLWHSDNHPGVVLQVMVYLTDATRETGALRFIPRQHSRQALRNGFRDRDKAQHFLPTFESAQVVLEGQAGTVVLFDGNLIHRASAPLRGHRDVIDFQILPSLVPWDKHFSAAKDHLADNYNYPGNPFRV